MTAIMNNFTILPGKNTWDHLFQIMLLLRPALHTVFVIQSKHDTTQTEQSIKNFNKELELNDCKLQHAYISIPVFYVKYIKNVQCILQIIMRILSFIFSPLR